MSARIDHLRTAFITGGGEHHELDARRFAAAMLKTQKDSLRRTLDAGLILDRRQADSLFAARIVGEIDRENPVAAYVNAGRWLARCECGGCEFIDLEDPVFFCLSCHNRAFGHRLRRVIRPATPARRAIEAALLARPVREDQDWIPGERVVDLEAQNASRGLPARAEAC